MRRTWLPGILILLLGASFILPSISRPASASPFLAKKHCHYVLKKVHGKKKRVKVCTTVKPTPSPTPTATPTSSPTPTATVGVEIAGPSLRGLADQHGLLIGNQEGFINDPRVLSVLVGQFNYLDANSNTLWANLEPTQGQINWSHPDTPPYILGPDFTAQFIRDHHMSAYGMLLFGSPGSYPAWLDTVKWTRDQAIAAMDQHIEDVMTHYKGIISVWTVVNEYGDWPNDPFLRLIGPDYIDLAFQKARQVANQIDPTVKLIYNDTGNESVPSDVFWGKNTQKTLDIVRRLKAAGLIDGVGIQGHYIAPYFPQAGDVIKTIQQYELIVPVYVTEYDDDIRNLTGTRDQRFALQAQYDSTMVGTFLKAGVKNFMFFGIGDKYSWRETYGSDASPLAAATLFDDNIRPKPNFFAVQSLLENPPPVVP